MYSLLRWNSPLRGSAGYTLAGFDDIPGNESSNLK